MIAFLVGVVVGIVVTLGAALIAIAGTPRPEGPGAGMIHREEHEG